MGNCSKKRFFQLGIKTAHLAQKLGVFGNHKTNYVVKTTEFGVKPRAVRGNGVFSRFTKRITLLKQRNWGGNRAAGAETGCFGDSQNELRCKNNGIRGETARHAQKLGVLGIHKTNYVVKATEFAGNWRGTLDLEG